MNCKIPLFKIYYDAEDIKNITDVIRSGMHWAEGQVIKEFEDNIAKYIGSKYCVVFNSGTSALHAILSAYGIKEGNEVIVPSFTFIATANAPLFVGAKPVFADIEEETFGLDPLDVEKKITSKTKAVIPIHYGGCPCKVKELREIAKKNKLVLIEDAAEAFGAKIGNKKIGTFSDAAMFSFCQNKIITTGEGGAIVTNSRRIYGILKSIRSHGRPGGENNSSSIEPSDYISLGYNFRMPSFVAALGIAQLKKIDKILEMRRENARYLTARLTREIKEIITPSQQNDSFHVYQLYTIRIKKYRDELKKYLVSKGIMTKIYFPPVHLTEFYKNKYKQRYKLTATERVAKQVLSLPMYPALKRKEIDYMVEEIKRFIKEQNEKFL